MGCLANGEISIALLICSGFKVGCLHSSRKRMTRQAPLCSLIGSLYQSVGCQSITFSGEVEGFKAARSSTRSPSRSMLVAAKVELPMRALPVVRSGPAISCVSSKWVKIEWPWPASIYLGTSFPGQSVNG